MLWVKKNCGGGIGKGSGSGKVLFIYYFIFKEPLFNDLKKDIHCLGFSHRTTDLPFSGNVLIFLLQQVFGWKEAQKDGSMTPGWRKRLRIFLKHPAKSIAVITSTEGNNRPSRQPGEVKTPPSGQTRGLHFIKVIFCFRYENMGDMSRERGKEDIKRETSRNKVGIFLKFYLKENKNELNKRCWGQRLQTHSSYLRHQTIPKINARFICSWFIFSPKKALNNHGSPTIRLLTKQI